MTLFNIIPLGGFLLLFALPASAQKAYTLEECRQMALENNVKVRNAANSVSAAEETRKSAYTKYFPTVSASGSAYVADKGLVEMSLMGQTMPLAKDGVMGGVTLTQPLYAGGQIINANKLAQLGVKVNELQKEQSENEVRTTVEQYFWQVVTIEEKLKTVASVETMLQSLCKDVSAAVTAGVTTRNDLLQVQLKQNDMESTRTNLENTLSVCRMVLAQYVGLSENAISVTADIPTTAPAAIPAEIFSDPATALPQTAEYRLLQSNVEANQLQTKLAKGKNLPTVAAMAGYMCDNLMDKSHPFGIAGITVSVPLSGWWGGTHDVRKQKLQQANAENSLRDNSDLLKIKMQQEWNELTNAHKQMLIAEKSVEQSTENLRLNNDYYHAGTTTMSDLLDAQRLFQQSRDKYVESYAAYRTQIVEYLVATGR